MDLRPQIDEINNRIISCLKSTADKSDPDGLVGKISELASLIPSSAQALAMAEMLYNEKIGALMETEQFSKMNTTDKKMLFQGKASKEIALMTFTERLNKGITHAIDGYRSILSFVKSEMDNLRNV